MAVKRVRGDDSLIILFLGMLSGICIFGIVVLQVAGQQGSSDALQTIASLCVGALASRISQSGKEEEPDDFAVLGRAATKGIIAEAMRQMADDNGGSSS